MRKMLPLLLLGLLLTGCAQEPRTIRDFLLNTEASVTVYHRGDLPAAESAMELCRQLERTFSRTDPDSELARLNRREITEVSQPLAEVISLSLAYSRLTDGAFDVTMGAVTQLWDFTSPVLPKQEEIDVALSSVDWKSVAVKGNTVILTDPHTVLDLGAIAKGYIADRMAALLREQGVASAVISLGGNLYFLGGRPDGSDYQAGIQDPHQARNIVIGGLPVRDCSVVTSGIYERCFTMDGKFYHHILDPSTGFPAETELSSVTIVSSSSVEADALSTACFLLGVKRGMELIEATEGAEAVFITEELEILLSSGLEGVFYEYTAP